MNQSFSQRLYELPHFSISWAYMTWENIWGAGPARPAELARGGARNDHHRACPPLGLAGQNPNILFSFMSYSPASRKMGEFMKKSMVC